jgi:hypothetical protein
MTFVTIHSNPPPIKYQSSSSVLLSVMSNPFASLEDSDGSDIEEDAKLERVNAGTKATPMAASSLSKKKSNAKSSNVGTGGAAIIIPAPLPKSQEEIKQRQRKQEIVKKEAVKTSKKEISAGGAPRVGKQREHDRQSGTGRGKEVAKGGAGSANWGKNDGRQVLADVKAAEQIEKVEKQGEEVDASKAEASTKTETVVPPVPEEPPKLTLKQYEALKKSKRTGKGFEQLKVRTAVTTDVAGQVYRKTKDADETQVLIKIVDPTTTNNEAPITNNNNNNNNEKKAEKKTIQRIELAAMPMKSKENDPRGGGRGNTSGSPRGKYCFFAILTGGV